MSEKSKRIEIQLRHNSDPAKMFLLKLLPEDTNIGQKWFEDVKQCTLQNKILEKEMSFFGWINSPFNLTKLCELINEHIDIINEASFKLNWDRQPFIENKLDPKKIDQVTLNLAHHQFELLIGQFWDNSKYYKLAGPELRYSIQRLNSLIHEVESFLDTMKFAKEDPNISIASIRLTYNNVMRDLLEPEDYKYFTTDLLFGDINLGYCQSGKTHIEAWYDDDEHIQEDNINGLRYHSGDTIINFVSCKEPIKGNREKFHRWLNSRGINNIDSTYFIDSKGQYQGLGWLKVGRIDVTPFENMKTTEIQDLIGQYQDIYQVTCIDSDEVISRVFPERRGSSDLVAKIIKEL